MRDTIDMAREAGFTSGELAHMQDNFLFFANLVAAAEREEIAQFIEQTNLGSLPDSTALHYARLLKSYSAAIRARGETK